MSFPGSELSPGGTSSTLGSAIGASSPEGNTPEGTRQEYSNLPPPGVASSRKERPELNDRDSIVLVYRVGYRRAVGARGLQYSTHVGPTPAGQFVITRRGGGGQNKTAETSSGRYAASATRVRSVLRGLHYTARARHSTPTLDISPPSFGLFIGWCTSGRATFVSRLVPVSTTWKSDTIIILSLYSTLSA